MNDNEKCYVWKPANIQNSKRKPEQIKGLPAKTPKAENQGPIYASRQTREVFCREIWNIQRDGIQQVLDEANDSTLSAICDFLSNSDASGSHDFVPTGYVLAGPDTTSHASFFDRLALRLDRDQSKELVTLNSNESPSLKNALKTLMSKITNEDDGDDEDFYMVDLGYDLEKLHAWFRKRYKTQLIIALEDSEAFHPTVLADIIDQIGAWNDRIPAFFLFGIATSIEVFQERLPQKALRVLKGHQFNALQSHELLELIFASTITGRDIPVRIGPKLAKMIMKRPREHIQSPQEFIDAFQYAYMCHFYTNPLTIFLKEDVEISDIPVEQFQQLRYTQSFRKMVEYALANDVETAKIESFLSSNSLLLEEVRRAVALSLTRLERMSTVLQLLEHLTKQISGPKSEPFSILYIMALQNDLIGSPLYRELLLALGKTPSDKLPEILSSLRPFLAGESEALKEMNAIIQSLLDFLNSVSKDKLPLKSKYDRRNQTARTTVVAHKVELSIHKANISEEEAKYSTHVDVVVSFINRFITENVVSVKDVLFHEIIFYDETHADSAVFLPKTRGALERALSYPQDYLGCECCRHTEEETILSTQPAAALLYQLTQESGATINVHDLWTAFKGVLGDEHDEKEAMFLFQRALTELRSFGMFKATKKKADHIIRTQWRGL